MGYSTDFEGAIEITPPLNPQEIEYLRRFADTRHMDRARGPYFAPGDFGHGDESDVRGQNAPDAGSGQPSLWCNFVSTEDGTALVWNGNEKTYDAEAWIAYLIDTFLKPRAAVQRELTAPQPGRFYDPAFAHFTFNHVLNGTLNAEGEGTEDLWRIVVTDNTVRRQNAEIVWPEENSRPASASRVVERTTIAVRRIR